MKQVLTVANIVALGEYVDDLLLKADKDILAHLALDMISRLVKIS